MPDDYIKINIPGRSFLLLSHINLSGQIMDLSIAHHLVRAQREPASLDEARYGMDDGQFCVSSTYRDSYICFTKLLYYHLHLRIPITYLYWWWSHRYSQSSD